MFGQFMTVFVWIFLFCHVILLHGNNDFTSNNEVSMGFWFKIKQFETALSRFDYGQLSQQRQLAVKIAQAAEKSPVRGEYMELVDERIDWAYSRLRKGTWKHNYGSKADIAAYVDTFDQRMDSLRTWADWNFRTVLSSAMEGNRQAVYCGSKICFRYVDHINNEARPKMPMSWELLGSGIFIASELPYDRNSEAYTPNRS